MCCDSFLIFDWLQDGKKEERTDGSGNEKKQRIEGNWKGKQMGKQAKENSEDNYIHVRAKRGQATTVTALQKRYK